MVKSPSVRFCFLCRSLHQLLLLLCRLPASLARVHACAAEAPHGLKVALQERFPKRRRCFCARVAQAPHDSRWPCWAAMYSAVAPS